MEIRTQIPKCILTVLNQPYELEQKLKKHGDPANLTRNVGRMKDAFAEDGLQDAGAGQRRIRLLYEDPMGHPFKETRTDLEVTISGSGTENLVVVEVVKPIIRAIVSDGVSYVVQKGVVIVESRKE
jgi:hypothetical protein